MNQEQGEDMRKPRAKKVAGRLSNGRIVEPAWCRNIRLAEQRLIDFVWGNAIGSQREQLLKDIQILKGPWQHW